MRRQQHGVASPIGYIDVLEELDSVNRSRSAMPLYQYTLLWSSLDRGRPSASSQSKLLEPVSERDLTCRLDEDCVALQFKGRCCSSADDMEQRRCGAQHGVATVRRGATVELTAVVKPNAASTSQANLIMAPHGNCSERPNQTPPRPHRIGTRSCCTHLLLGHRPQRELALA